MYHGESVIFAAIMLIAHRMRRSEAIFSALWLQPRVKFSCIKITESTGKPGILSTTCISDDDAPLGEIYLFLICDLSRLIRILILL